MVTGINRHVVTQYLQLTCNRCGKQWRSRIYNPNSSGRPRYAVLQPAWDMGWRAYVGGRSLHAYCPDHHPSVPMRLIYPERAQQ